ncbi:MAG TPA: methyltransferase domain-containing protein [Anaerolineales bacterium]|nr:methyltransferase domain-containing protein [Anaerolineales bacterium]
MAWLTASNLGERRLPHQWSGFRRWLQRRFFPVWMGSLRRTKPLSDSWGFDRGRPVDRYYIESFLNRHRQDIRGRLLEILNNDYARKYGALPELVDVLDIDPANRQATIVADLAAADSIASNSFDCFILTQTLQLVYDVKAAITHSHRILRPGGVLLVTIPAVSRLAGEGYTDYWRFTPDSCKRLFGEVFGDKQVTVSAYGNVLSAIAFLEGMASEELSKRELDVKDERYPVLLAIRAVKN